MIPIDKMFRKVDKIWPMKKAIPTLLLTLISLIIVGVAFYMIEENNQNKKMYSLEINGKIERLIKADRIYFIR